MGAALGRDDLCSWLFVLHLFSSMRGAALGGVDNVAGSSILSDLR